MATDHLAMLRLLTWLSPSFPVGAFSYSHGLEFAVHDQVVMALSAERHLETMDQGRAFSAAARPWTDVFNCGYSTPYPVAVGAAAAAMKIGIEPVCVAHLHACAANLVSAGIRLIPLGQSEGTHLMASLEDLIIKVASKAAGSSLADLGSATFAADMAAMRHETLPVRLFRS